MKNIILNKKSIVKFAAIALCSAGLCYGQGKNLDVIFMHDVHSFMDASARAKTLIDNQKNKNPKTLVLDAGDFSMGTLYQTVFSSHASELRILGKLGVEATVVGNHEFDFGAKGLANMFLAAKNSGEKVPSFVLCNADWSVENEYTKTVKAALDVYGNQKYIMLNKDGVKVAVLGTFGKDALRVAPTCQITFKDPIEAVKETVAYIKENENPDVIVCISHSGTSKIASRSEDELMAKAVPELDLIISGHTHTTLEEPIISGNTVIASCGAYNECLGSLSLSQNEDGRWKLSSYKLLKLDESVPENPSFKSFLAKFGPIIDKEYLAPFSLTSRQVLTKSPKKLDINHEEGYVLAEAMYNTLVKMGIPVDFATVPSGCLRGTGYEKGDVTVSDVFESYSLGIGPDGISGYPLIKVWLTGKEVKNVCEIDASLSPYESTVRLFMHGISYDYNPKRMLLNKVTDVYKVNPDGTKEKIQKNKMYCAVVDIYTGQMLGSVLDMTKGLVEIAAHNEDGSLVEKWEDRIIYRENGTELKGWIAIAEGLNEMPVIGDYSKAEEFWVTPKVSSNPFKLLKAPSKLANIVHWTAVIFVLLIAGIVTLIVLAKKKKAKNKK